MTYTDEILKKELMHYFGYSKSESEMLITTYSCLNELDDLIAVVEAKKESIQRLQ